LFSPQYWQQRKSGAAAVETEINIADDTNQIQVLMVVVGSPEISQQDGTNIPHDDDQHEEKIAFDIK
jgi:hypothetical protein